MEDGGGVGREMSHKRPHPSEDDDDDVEFISFKKEKRDPELNNAKETEDDVVIVEDTQGATGTSANDAKLLGKEDFVVTYFKPSDTIKYPHAREDCRVHKFHSTIPSQPYGGNSKQENTTFCDSCYCYVCDIPAKECQQWIQGDHCNAHSKDTSWKLKRKKTVADNSRKKARQSFASHPSLRSSLSKKERETEGMSSFPDSSLDEILNRIDSTYKEYSAAPEGNDCDIEDDCYCYCHEDSYWGRRRRRCWYDYEEESCYECEHNHYDGTSASYQDYDPVRRALNSAVTSARTHWQNKKPVEALVILEETMRSLCLHQPCDVTLNSYSGETTDGGLVSSKCAIMQSIEELLVNMFLDKSGILLSSLKEKALSAIKRTFDLAPQNSGNIGPNIALGLKSWDDQELLAVLNGSYNSGKDNPATASSLRGNSTAEVIVVEDTTSQSNTAGNSRNSNFTEDYLVAKKRLQILENEKRWQEAANYIQKVNIRGSQYGIESHLKDKLLTYQAHLGKWNEVRLELIKIMPNQAGRIRLVRMEPTDFLNIMKCFTTGQDIEMMPASSPSTATPSPGVNMDEVFRIYLYAMATGQNYSLKHNEKCVSWFIAWTCQETLQELSLGEFQRLEKQAKSVISTSQTKVTNLEHMSNLNSKVGRAVTATCWLSSNLSSRSSSYLNVSTIMDGYKNNVWLAVFLLMKLCDDLKAYFSYGLSEACHKVANWITTHGGFVLQHGHPGSITLEKVLSLLPLAKAKELLENILAAVLTGDRTPEERVKIIQQAKRVVSKLTNNRQLMMGRILLYMAKDGQCKEVQEELMKEKQDAKFRPVKALAQIGDEDFLDIMKALVESVTKLRHWGADQSQATRYIENEIFLLCIYGLLWNDKVQQSMSFISWFLGLLCAMTMEEPSDAMMKILEDIAKSIREAVDKRAAERKAASIVGKECKAVVACILALPGLKCREYSDQLKMKIILDALKENKWLLMLVLNRPDGPSGTVVTEWICEENGPKILNDLTEEATTRLVSFMDKGTGYDILKRLVTMSDKKGLGKKRRAVQFAMCLLNQLQKYDRTSNDILAFIMSKVDPIIRAINDPSAKTSLQQMYQKNFEFCPTMKSLEELKKVCSPEEWLLKKDCCLVSYINDIKNISTFLSCLDLLMKSGSDHITELLSLPVAREGCTKRGDDAFNPACSAVIKKVAAVLKEIHSGEVTQFLQKARSWLVAESWGSLLCVGKPCKNKVQQSMDVLWKVIAEISPQEFVNILKAAMEAVQGRLNVISVNLQMRNAYVGWLFRVKDAFQLGQQLFQFGQILHKNLGVLRRKKELTQAVRTSGLLHNLPNKENPLKQNPSMQNAKKKGNGASPNLSKALKTLNISNKGSGTSKDDTATLLMKELIVNKPSPVADTGRVKQQTTDATPMEWARSDTGDSVKMASRPSSSATSVQPAGKSADKHVYQTRSKDKSNVQSTGTRASAKTTPPTSASATGPNSSTASVVPKNAPNKTGEQNKRSPELVDIVSKILELTKTTGVDGAFQLIIGRMTGKVASSSPMTEDIISKLLKLKGPINLKIGNNKLVINSQLASSTPVIPNVPSPHPAQTMPAPRNVTTVPYADPTTDSISQSAPRHMSGRTGPNLGPRSVLLPPQATSSISTYVPGAIPTVPHTRGTAVPVLPSTNSTPVTSALSSASSSTTQPIGLSTANNNNNGTPGKSSTPAPSAKFASGILKQIISTIDIKKGTASYRVVGKPGESSKTPSSDEVSSTEPMEVPMEVD